MEKFVGILTDDEIVPTYDLKLSYNILLPLIIKRFVKLTAIK